MTVIRITFLRGPSASFPPNFAKIDLIVLRNPANKQTNKQTNTSENITSLISGGSKPESGVLCNWQTVHRDWAWKSSRLSGNSR